MARPKSETKRNALLNAAIAVFAERGIWATPTLAISKAAGVAEGTLFTYFTTKDVLLNELYQMIRLELADALLPSLPEQADVHERLQHFWAGYVHWGLANLDKLKVLEQLKVSEQITADSLAIGDAPFLQLEQMVRDNVVSGKLYNYPIPFMVSIFDRLVEATIGAITSGRTEIDYCTVGFEIFWRAIAKSSDVPDA